MDISVVIPLYTEAESLPERAAWIERVMKEHDFSYEVIFVDDGSTDGSWEVIRTLTASNPAMQGGSFRRNYGKSPALNTGFGMAQGDVKDDLLTVYCSTEVQKSMLDQKVVTDVLSEVTSRAVGREIRVRFLVGERPGAKKRDKMQDLLRMGSKFDNFTVK